MTKPFNLSQHLTRSELNVRDYGAKGDNATDDTAAIMAAIAAGAGQDIAFPRGTYLANNLVLPHPSTRLIGKAGTALIKKNANGVLLTCTGDEQEINGLKFFGEAPTFTGHNIVATGQNFQAINCSSRYAAGRALLAQKRVCISGSNSIWHTADTSPTGYDIENGVSGTATLYSQLTDVYTSQSTGGLLFIDCGSQTVKGGQFGKYTIKKGTGPVGVNGGHTIGCRITGDVLIEVSNAVFAGCMLGGSRVVVAATTSGVSIDASNIFGNDTLVTNLGNSSNFIERLGFNSLGIGFKLTYGASERAVPVGGDPSVGPSAELWVLPSGGPGPDPGNATIYTPGFLQAAFAKGLKSLAADGSSVLSLAMVWHANGSTQFGHTGGSSQCVLASGSGGVTLLNATTSFNISSGIGSPEGVVGAAVGALYIRTDGGAGTTLYVKQSGTGNTGWAGK